LLQDAIRRTLMIAEQAGIRALLTHPVDDKASRFYQRFGFIPSPLRDQQLLLLLKQGGNATKVPYEFTAKMSAILPFAFLAVKAFEGDADRPDLIFFEGMVMLVGPGRDLVIYFRSP